MKNIKEYEISNCCKCGKTINGNLLTERAYYKQIFNTKKDYIKDIGQEEYDQEVESWEEIKKAGKEGTVCNWITQIPFLIKCKHCSTELDFILHKEKDLIFNVESSERFCKYEYYSAKSSNEQKVDTLREVVSDKLSTEEQDEVISHYNYETDEGYKALEFALILKAAAK